MQSGARLQINTVILFSLWSLRGAQIRHARHMVAWIEGRRSQCDVVINTAPSALLGSIKCHHCLSLGAGTSMSSFFEPSPPLACLRECEFQSRRGQGGERPGRRHSSGEKGWFTQYECLFFYVSGAHRVSRAQQHVEHSVPIPKACAGRLQEYA